MTLSLLALLGGMCRSGLPAHYATRVGARPFQDSCATTTRTHVLMSADVAPRWHSAAPTVPAHCVSPSPSLWVSGHRMPCFSEAYLPAQRQWQGLLEAVGGFTTLSEVGAVADGHAEGCLPVCLPWGNRKALPGWLQRREGAWVPPRCGQAPPLAEDSCALPGASHCWVSQGSTGLQNWDLSGLWVHCS